MGVYYEINLGVLMGEDICPYWVEHDEDICRLTFKRCSCGADRYLCEFPEWVKAKKERDDV